MSSRARLVLVVLCAAQFMAALDFSILNIALPTLGPDLGLSDANLQWAVTAFALPSGGFLLLFGRIGDMVGRRRIFICGLLLFTLASVLATVAWGVAPFLIARALQGVATAAIVPTGMALLTTSFAEGALRDRALGISGMVLSLGFTIGMLLGGALTQAFGWRSTMALGVILGAIILVMVPALVTESRAGAAQRLDLPGAITVTGGLLALIYAVSTASTNGWAEPDVIGALIAAVVLLIAFGIVESRARQPLVSLHILRRRAVAWGNFGGLVTFSMMSAVVFLSTLYLQQVLDVSPAVSGLVFGIVGIFAAASGMLAPRVVGRFGSRPVLVLGLAVQAVFVASLIWVGPHDGILLVTIAASLACVGHLTAIVSYGITATSGLSNDEQGLATGLATTAQQVGITIGIPIISAIAAGHTAALAAAGTETVEATLSGFRLGFGVDAAIVATAAVLIGLFLLGAKRTRSR
ncbi:MFS transporter [Leifsonia sp. EB34]|uniref:MFS transporter n=1 Tax=Leifsonia sp. EB34 TaxID=3156303 RepID=UPI0035198413